MEVCLGSGASFAFLLQRHNPFLCLLPSNFSHLSPACVRVCVMARERAVILDNHLGKANSIVETSGLTTSDRWTSAGKHLNLDFTVCENKETKPPSNRDKVWSGLLALAGGHGV